MGSNKLKNIELEALHGRVKALDSLRGDVINSTGNVLATKKKQYVKAVEALDAWKLRSIEARTARTETVKRAYLFILSLDIKSNGDILDNISTAAKGLKEPTKKAKKSAEALFFPKVENAVGKMSDAIVKVDAAASALETALEASDTGAGTKKDASAVAKAVKEAVAALKELT